MTTPRIAVVGAGLIGRRHAEEIDSAAAADLAAIVDTGPSGPELAGRHGVALHRSLAELIARDPPDGVVLATPNRMHVDGGLACVAAGIPVLVEKPVADTVEGAARTASTARGFAVEDTAAMLFSFAGGALGTFLLSDVAASPRSWEQTSRENADYAAHDDEDCYHLAGTRGSLSVPTMRLRVFEGERSWSVPFTTSVPGVERADPLARQIAHFAAVIRDGVPPVCSGRDGLASLRVVAAVVESARTGRPVDVG